MKTENHATGVATGEGNKTGNNDTPLCAQQQPGESSPMRTELIPEAWRHFPAFQKPLPLKVGIREDLIALGHEDEAVRLFLSQWCRQLEYQAALVKGAPRYDLYGVPCGEVAAGEAFFAKRFGGIRPRRKKKGWDGLKGPGKSPVKKADPKDSPGKDAALERLAKAMAGTRPTLGLRRQS